MRRFANHMCIVALIASLQLLIVSVPAFADWLMIHGSGGQIMNENDVSALRRYYWGLNFHLAAGNGEVQFPVPTLNGVNGIGGQRWKARFIRLNFFTSNECRVTEINVLNGSSVVKTLKGPWSGAQSLTLDLEKHFAFPSGMNISAKLERDLDGSFNFQFYGAGARFDPR